MKWLEITIPTTSDGIEIVAAALSVGGFSELIMEDQVEYETFLEENRAYWDYVDERLQKQMDGLSQIRLYVDAEDMEKIEQLRHVLAHLRKRDPESRLGALCMKVTEVPDTDWEEGWKDNYPAQDVGEKLTVLPYWLADQCPEGRLPVILDPGLTFGTGSHPSTRMMLEALEETVQPGAVCLDLGSGSGILSLAALRLGAKQAIGVDIDPKAEDIARENAGFNGFAAPEFTALTGNVLADRKLMEHLQQNRYDIVLVNIVADVIISLAPVLPKLLDENSVLLLSGILETRLEDVIAALNRAGLTVTRIESGEEWRCIRAKR